MSPATEHEPARPVAVLGVGAAAPSLRLAAADVGAAWGSGGGKGTVALCDADEDTLTLAWRAAVDALEAAHVDAAALSGLWWGTARPPFAEGPSHAYLATALGIGEAGVGALCSGSPHAGMEALLAAWDALAAGHATVALVVMSDALVPGLGTAGETTTGAGAGAVVLGSLAPRGGPVPTGAGGALASSRAGPSPNGSSPPARLVARATRMLAAVDRYRADAAGATGDVYDARLFREEVFVPLLAAAGAALTPAGGAAVEAWAVADPDGKLAGAVARRLGAPLVSGSLTGAVGDTGAAAALLGVLPAWADALASGPATLGMIGYGGGRATAVAAEVLRPVPGAAEAVARLGEGRPVTYVEAVKARGQLAAMSDPIAMGVPPTGAAFVRGNVEMLQLEGARCGACGTISTPPSIHPACVVCGRGQLDVVRLARTGTVHTFVVNQTMPPPFQAPLPMVVVDLDDGARLMVQGSAADSAALSIGDVVTLSLRRYALERGVPVYGYKAFRSAGMTSAPPTVAGVTASTDASTDAGVTAKKEGQP